MNTFDQYNRPIPQDLTLLEFNLEPYSEEKVNKILHLDWYCFEGNKTNHVFVSNAEFEKVLDGLNDIIDPEDCALKGKIKLVKIDNVLKRYGEEDGFYWA